MDQRFIVNGINNDKIELMSNYDVRKLNRLLDAKDQMWAAKVKKAREEIQAYCEDATNEKQKIAFNACLMVIDNLIKEVEK